MGKLRKSLGIIICMAIVVSLFAACSKDDTTSPTTDVNTPSSSSSNTDEDTEEKSNFNKTGFPIVNEPITLTAFGSRDQNQAEWKNVKMLKEYEKLTNVHIDYQEVPAQGFDEKKNLLFASNDLPDIFIRAFITPVEISMYGPESGQLIALDDLIAEYAPNLTKIYNDNPLIKASLTAADGKMYTVPALDFSDTGRMGFKQWINQEWLAAVGKEVPKTIEEFKDVLKAFRDNDPNKNGEKDEIPLGVREPSSVYVLGGSFGLDHQMKECINIEDGKVHFWLTDDRFKEYLQYLNELYTEKLLWQDYYKNDRPAWRSNLANASFGAMYMPYSDVFLNVEDQYIGYEPLKGPYGDQLWSDANDGVGAVGAFAISSTCEYPEVAMRWVDFFYSEEGSLYFRFGIEGETFYYDENNVPRFKEEILKDERGFMTALGEINLVPGGGFPCLITNVTDGVVASDKTKEVASMHMPYLPEKIYSAPSFNVEERERVNAIIQDLNKYRDEAVTKFIIGEWGFDKWEEYCDTLNKIGLPELEQIYQQAFERMYGE